MNICFANSNEGAHLYQRLGLIKALNRSGHNAFIWDSRRTPVFDLFDTNDIDVFIGTTFEITPGLIQCLKEKPCKVVMKAGDYGEACSKYDLTKYEILVASESELSKVRSLYDAGLKIDVIGCHYIPEKIQETHGYWNKFGCKVASLGLGCDVYDYHPSNPLPMFECDLSIVGGLWKYKQKTAEQYVFPLLDVKNNYRVKIFGNQSWPSEFYLGNIETRYVKHLFASTKIGLHFGEPHTSLGYEISERPMKLMSSKCFCLSDYNESLSILFTNNELYMAKTPQEYHEMVDYFLKNEDERRGYIERGYETVIDKHTYFHRAAELLSYLGMDIEAKQIMDTYDVVKKELAL